MSVSNPTLTLKDLPAPPPGKTGWPWTKAAEPLSAKMPDDSEYPLISIVTPSYNQGQFIEETIRSILLQGYPNLEYLIIDGGSTDNSVEIIKKYERYLSYWISESDKGPTEAINKGWQKTNGEIIAYLNSDDVYFPTTLATIAQAFRQDLTAQLICGNELQIDAEGYVIRQSNITQIDRQSLLNLNFIPQPSTFIKKSVVDSLQGLNPEIKYTFDFELWVRITRSHSIKCIPDLLAVTRWHNDTITLTSRAKIGSELVKIIDREIDYSAADFSTKEQKQILFKVNYLSLQLHLEKEKIIGSVKYAAIAFWLAPNFHQAFNITRQYYRYWLNKIKKTPKSMSVEDGNSQPKNHWLSLIESKMT